MAPCVRGNGCQGAVVGDAICVTTWVGVNLVARVGAARFTVTRLRRARGREIWRMTVGKTQRVSRKKAEKNCGQ